MKRCPNCQQTFPDNAPDFCPNDGTRMTAAAPQQQQYAAGAGYQQPYGAPPPAPQQNWPPPQQGIPGAGYYPQPGHAPYAAHAAGGAGLGKIAMLCGLASLLLTILFFSIIVMIKNGNFGLVDLARPSYYGMVLTGIAGLLLGIISLVQRRGSKGKGIIGICTSLPALAFFIYVIVDTGTIG